MRSVIWSGLFAAACGATLAGQSLTSHMYLPFEHWTVPFIEHLIGRGAIVDPTPMIRPWTVGDISTALDRADTHNLTLHERQTLDAVRDALSPPDETATFAFEIQGGFRSSTHARRDNVREAGPGHTQPVADGHLALQAGALVVVAQRTIDFNLDYDPDFTGKRDVPVQGRSEWAYGAIRTQFVTAEFGTLYRNWGPPAHDGLVVSPVPYSYDQFYAFLGVPHLNLRMQVAQLDDVDNRNGERSKRWWIVHRFTARPTRALTFAAWQTSLLSGPGRSLDFAFLNPFRLNIDSRNDQGGAVAGQDRTVNSQIGLDVDLRLSAIPHISASFQLDDIQCFLPDFLCPSSNNEPSSYGLTLSLDGSIADGTWSLVYTQVSNLVNRTPDPAEVLVIRGVGLGRNFSDYDQATAKAAWVVLPGLIVGPELTFLRQGEGDFRQPFPPVADFADTPTIFAGTQARTLRGAAHATVSLPFGLWARADVGVHRTTNAGNIAGATRSTFVATIQARYRLGRTWTVLN